MIAARATRLAREHGPWTVADGPARPILEIIEGSGRDLSETYDTLARAQLEGRELSPGGQWFLDNFYLIRDQRRAVMNRLRSRFFQKLPKVSEGPHAGYPRVLALTAHLVDLLDNALERGSLLNFLAAYQRELPLSLAELWALPTTIQIVLIRRLQRLANEVRTAHLERAEADRWAERIGKHSQEDPVEGVVVARELLAERGGISDELALQVIERLADHGTATRQSAEWLERRLTVSEEVMREVARRATQRQISVANAITALRWSAEARWGRIVEAASVVEAVLRRDPTGVYGRMDFQTRDRYRHVVEELARYSVHREAEVAERLLEVTKEQQHADGPSAVRDMGYHLLGPGAIAFERSLGFKPPFLLRVRRWSKRHPGLFYFGGIAAVTAAGELAVLRYAEGHGLGPALVALAALSALLPLVDLAVALVNRLAAWAVPPRTLPKMDAERGVSEEHGTLVVVPTLIRSPRDVLQQIEHLEIHARANPHPLLRFALLTDFRDADAEHLDGEDETLAAGVRAIRRLNERDADAWGDRFFLLHRRRLWNPQEGVWMGRERKRGKIEELNRLLLDPDAETTFDVIEGDLTAVAGGGRIRYVITLDADTQLPPGAALDLVRTAAHPLNRPVHDPAEGRVVRGYSILQPRVAIAPRGASRSAFARIFSGHVGIDPYTTAVSDVYQDLFGDGIYTGKGLYDVAAFERALDGMVPENTVLSHDLLEGSFARAALVTDVEVYDDYPSQYLTFAKRLHRWIRGDWQIAPWLFGGVRRADGSRGRNPISFLGRWRIFDNLRRSVTGAGLLAFLLLGWVALTGSPVAWTLAALGVLAFPVYVNLTTAVFNRPRHTTWLSWFEGVDKDLSMHLLQTGLTIVFLPHLAFYGLDAIARSMWRMLVSRRHMLEWTTAKDAEAFNPNTLAAYVRFMWPSVAWAAGVAVLVARYGGPRAWVAAGPFLVVWAAAPAIAWWLSRPSEREPEILDGEDRAWLRSVAHRTWLFFDRYVDERTSWIAPDNLQETPFRGIAERTSPTNIGLGLLALQVARDFGWIGWPELLDRLEAAAETVDALESWEGHLYNWYGTDDGRTLWPRYVSTVDSGNLVASWVTLASGLAEIRHAPWPPPAEIRGLRDDVGLLWAVLPEPATPQLRASVDALVDAVQEARADDPAAWLAGLDALAGAAEGLERLPAPSGDAVDLPGHLASRIRLRVEAAREEARALLPWLPAGEELPPAVEEARSLRELREALAGSDDPRARPVVEAIDVRFERADRLAAWCHSRAEATRFQALYDAEADLFHIGFNVDTLQPDPGHYDLLASEARLASFLAIAKGDVPVDHWFRLGRPFATTEESSVLLSWSGTMFEYLMPLLLTGSWPGTLLDETYAQATHVQIRHGSRAGRPWGISESAYNTLNMALDYQYRAFGVPGLGLKRGLSQDYVAAPYASALAAMVLPVTAVANLRRLAEEGALGAYGYYDAIDYTPERVPPGEEGAVVATWMAHHQGMTLLALSNVLDRGRVRKRFQASPLSRSTELLLQERIPRRLETTDPHPMETTVDPGERQVEPPPVRYLGRERLDEPSPHGQLLSNGRYTAFVTQAGTGFSRWRDWELTRWRPDRVTDPLGVFFYLRDADSGRSWSVTPMPTRPDAGRIDTWMHLSKIESALVHDWIEAYVEVGVSPEDDVEVRRLTITNYGEEPRTLDVTSYVEVVLNKLNADRAHPAFSKLFVQTEALPDHPTLFAWRRPRKRDEPTLWMFHTMADGLENPAGIGDQWEFGTDRARFVGRGRTLARPAALEPGASLDGTQGSVLDPVFSLRRRVRIPPRERVVLSFCLGVADTREEAGRLADRYATATGAQRALELATAFGPAELQHLAVTGEEALALQALGSAILYGDPRLRVGGQVIRANREQQRSLWAYSISGDLPIVVMTVESLDQMDRVREMIRASEFWRLKGLDLDVVFINEHPPSYAEQLHDHIGEVVAASRQRTVPDSRGSFFVLRGDQLATEDRVLLLAVAHAFFDAGKPLGLPAPDPEGEGADPLERRARPAWRDAPAEGEASAGNAAGAGDGSPSATPALTFDNDYGGFDEEGRYRIRVPWRPGGGRLTPLPWINVVANERFGFTATESGGGYTWSVNSRENRLTPWCNDPVTDRPSEAIWIRDEEAGVYGSVTPRPTPFPADYETVHDFGQTLHRTRALGLETELALTTPPTDPVKLARLRIRNEGERPRRLSVVRYQEWVLGVFREPSARHVLTSRPEGRDAILACNHYNQEFAGRVAFARPVAPAGSEIHLTADRAAFLGRNHDVDDPVALERHARLDGRVGAGLEPCAAFQVILEVPPGETRTVCFVLGETDTEAAALGMLDRYGTVEAVDDAFRAATDTWERRLRGIRVKTPRESWNRILDGWLLYQSLSCRIWGRSAFYQSGGAYGYRDQLQDVMAMVYVDPRLTREQILRHARHQFVAGDVLHWWHPPTGRGIRSRFTDDLLWLPYVTAFYIRSTGDVAILDEVEPFVTARLLEPGEEEAYLEPERSDIETDLYDHCCRTLDRSLTEGRHGIPLMGSGDWNDGMNRVGSGGEGESVWLGFFLHTVLEDFLPYCEARGDDARVERYRAYLEELSAALNDAGWDGAWYRRAFYDDGTPLGSAENLECRIDAIAQAWSVISGVAPRERGLEALASAEEHLVDHEARLIRLLTPPFDETDHDPGYIKGYVPGVRENGGQYTHGVLWLVKALAEIGESDRAAALFDLLNPLHDGASRATADVYKVEPYVAAADVYSVEPHVGRGGWTWYTGSGAWMYRVVLESILGFRLDGDAIRLTPSIPRDWPGFEVTWRDASGHLYEIEVRAEGGVGRVAAAEIDGRSLRVDDDGLRIPRADAGEEPRTHRVVVRLADAD